MWENFLISLKIMGQGMLGIFAAILLIMLVNFIFLSLSTFLTGIWSKQK